MEAVILAAGKSSRIRELTKGGPKSLLFLGGQPILVRSVTIMLRCGINKVLIVVPPNDTSIAECLKITLPNSRAIEFLAGTGRNSTVVDLFHSLSFVDGDYFLVMVSDILCWESEFAKFINFCSTQVANGVAATVVYRSFRKRHAVWVTCTHDHQVSQMNRGVCAGGFISGGIHYFPSFIRDLRFKVERGGGTGITDLINVLLAEGHRVIPFEFKRIIDINTPEEYRRAIKQFRNFQ